MLSLPQIHPAARAALGLPAFETPEWRSDFARGIRSALGAAGASPAYLRSALARMRASLGASEIFEVSAPFASANTKLGKNATVTLAFTGASGADSARYNPCPALGACASACVLGATCGRARMNPAQIIGARARRLIAMREHPVAAGARLVIDAARARRLADAHAARIVARLNVATDIGFESMPEVAGCFERFGIDAYAYTKRPAAVRAALANGGTANGTRIVYSLSERASLPLAAGYLRAGGTVALVIGGLGRAPVTAHARAVVLEGQAFPVIDGDATDDRTQDPRGVVVGLRGKGMLSNPSKLNAADPYGFAWRPTDPRIMRA